ncbi:hypothetical protein CEY16_11300 [Halalkalibacillus sediminis]|uniref:Uncharacterized protein n=1 Tax=Halalkalibacillus sediminis TaxID=2018042 RepID=A0A2I0QSK0_9BACI|nr:hypothetical protein [Halalkalibacillus sediminis]PKR77313.1 hypothetical protein CEY16_11300 [Halalkalibacillus sediminis]
MAKVQLALAARGKDEGAFKAWGSRAVGKNNTKQWGSGKELLQHLVDATNGGENCIEKLYVFSHAWPYDPDGNRGGVKLGGVNISGFYSYPLTYDHRDARYIKDLRRLIKNGDIRFCDRCKVIFTGCRVASSKFPEEFIRLSRCKLIASNGSSHPDPGNPPGDETGVWFSTAGGWEEQQAEKNDGHYVGWIEYEMDSSGDIYEKELGKNISLW